MKVNYVLSGNNCVLDAMQSKYRSYQWILISTKMLNVDRKIKIFVFSSAKCGQTLVVILLVVCVTRVRHM